MNDSRLQLCQDLILEILETSLRSIKQDDFYYKPEDITAIEKLVLSLSSLANLIAVQKREIELKFGIKPDDQKKERGGIIGGDVIPGGPRGDLELTLMMKQQLSNRLETNPTPTKDELLIGCFIEEVHPTLRAIIPQLIERGITPRIDDPIEFWKKQKNGSYMMCLGMTATQIKSIDSNIAHIIHPYPVNQNRSDATEIRLVSTTSDEATIQDWGTLIRNLPNNDKRPIAIGSALEFRNLWQGKPKEYKSILLEGW